MPEDLDIADVLVPGNHTVTNTLETVALVICDQRLYERVHGALSQMAARMNSVSPGFLPPSVTPDAFALQVLTGGEAPHRIAVDTMDAEMKSEANIQRARKVHAVP